MTASRSFTGGCLCRGVRLEITPPTRWCAHCHCTMCRAAHGAAFVTWFGVAMGQVEVSDPEELLRWYASSPPARRGFCSRCGTTMLFESERWGDETHVALAVMDGAIDREPTAHVYFDRHVPWFEPGDDLQRRGGPTGVEPLQ